MVDSTFIRPRNNWIAAADQLVSEDKAIAHAVVIFVRGSSPREVGANMVISETQIWNTIGGGSLEFEVMKQARSLIKENSHIAKSSYRRVLNLALGPDMGQCCGGQVKVLLEILNRSDIDGLLSYAEGVFTLAHPLKTGSSIEIFDGKDSSWSNPKLENDTFILPTAKRLTPLFVYGAGHVGRALMKFVSNLDFDLHWVDIDEDRFPKEFTVVYSKVVAKDPQMIASHAPSDAYHIILTHSHPLDEAICFALLSRNKFEFCGLIGSQTKNARFRSRLTKMGVTDAQLKRLTCPIGIDDINSKEPVKVAISIVAQLAIWQEKNGTKVG